MQILRFVPLALGALPVAVAAACYGATSMRVEVLTDFTCGDQPHAAIYNGGDTDPLAATTECVASDAQTQSLGDLLFAPKDDRSATVTVNVALAAGPNVDPAKQCKSSPGTCVFASRKFTYLEHESGHLTVRLYKDCLGKQCGDGQTCIQGGQCVSSSVTCQGSNCNVAGETPFTPTDGGVTDAGRLEGGSIVDAPVNTTCAPPSGGVAYTTSSATSSFRVASNLAMFWYDGAGIYGLNMANRNVAQLASANTVTLLAAGPDNPWSVRAPSVPPASVFRGSTSVGTVQGSPAAMTIAPNGVGTNVSAYIASGSQIYQVPATAFSSPALPKPVKELSHDATHVIVVATDGSLYAMPLLGGTLSQSFTDAVTLIATNGAIAVVARAGSSPGIFTVNTTDNSVALLTHQVASTPLQLAVDPLYVYWVEKPSGISILHKYPLAGMAAAPTVVTTPDAPTIENPAPDGNATGCIYYWTPQTNGGLPVLRAVPK